MPVLSLRLRIPLTSFSYIAGFPARCDRASARGRGEAEIGRADLDAVDAFDLDDRFHIPYRRIGLLIAAAQSHSIFW